MICFTTALGIYREWDIEPFRVYSRPLHPFLGQKNLAYLLLVRLRFSLLLCTNVFGNVFVSN